MQTQTIDLDGQLLRVAVRRGSDASPPLLLFNGIGANLELVEPFVAALDDVTVIIFDVPGVGGSPAPLIPYRFSTLAVLADKLLTRLGFVDPVDVLGVSWGGALAQQFAHLYPERCRRLILAATSPGVIMVPARLSVLSKLIGPRRYTDPAYLRQIGAEHNTAARTRHDPALLEEHSRYIRRHRAAAATSINCWLHRVGPACPWLGGLRERRSSCTATTTPSCRSRMRRFSRQGFDMRPCM